METTDMSYPPDILNAVVPTLALPLAAISMFLNALASWIASRFGLQLRWDGPDRMVKALLKPRVLLGALLVNGGVTGVVYGWGYWHTLPSSLFTVRRMNEALASAAGPVGFDRSYTDSAARTEETDEAACSATIGTIQFTQVWRAQAGPSVYGAAVVSGNSVFVGSGDGYVYEFNDADGRLIRRFFIGTPVSAEPLIWHRRLFVGEGTHETRQARIYAFDLASGKFAGAFQTSGHTEGTPLVAHDALTGADHLLVAAGRDGMYSLDPLTLRVQWHFVGGHTDADARVRAGRAYFSTGVEKAVPGSRTFAYALNLSSGAQVWRVELPASGWMPAVFIGDQVCFGGGEIYTKSNVGYVNCYNAENGLPGSAMRMNAAVLSVPIRVRDHVVVADHDGQVCALPFQRSAQAWCQSTYGETVASPTYASQMILYPSVSDGLLAYDPESGRLLASWKPSLAEGDWKKTDARATSARNGSDIFLTDARGSVRKISIRLGSMN